MRVRTPRQPETRRPAQGPRRQRAAHPASPRPKPETPAAGPVALRADQRARRAGGPQDSALYQCACGSTFQAAVTASVHCGRCGEEQAW